MDVNRLRVASPTDVPARQPPRRPPPQGARFVKGPIPWTWLEQAMRLPGKALHVANMLWYYWGMKRADHVALSMSAFQKLGISRWAAARGLGALEKAGLIKVARGR